MQTNLGVHHGENCYIIKGTLLEEQNAFFRLYFGPHWKFLENSNLRICSLFKRCQFGSSLSIINYSLLEQQPTSYVVSQLPCKEFSSKCTSQKYKYSFPTAKV